jgi:hypothetical protein
MDRILERFGHVQEEYEHLGGYALESGAGPAFRQSDQLSGCPALVAACATGRGS